MPKKCQVTPGFSFTNLDCGTRFIALRDGHKLPILQKLSEVGAVHRLVEKTLVVNGNEDGEYPRQQ
jgi:hypothetical protein